MTKFHLVYGTIGSLAALISAASWAFGNILFRKLGEKVTPLGMNLGKTIIGTLYLGLIILLVGWKPISNHDFLLLSMSGLLGITLGDTFFFKALMYLGARLTTLLGTTAPIFTVFLAVIFLRERPSYFSWIGISLIVIGVTWVLWEQTPREELRQNRTLGIIYALLSTLCMSIGIIFAKVGIVTTSALEATFIRILSAFIGLTVWGCITGTLNSWVTPFKNTHLLKLIFFAVFVVIFGGFWLFLVSLKYIEASIATVLNSTTPLFILPMSAFFLQEKVSPRAIIGAAVAVVGVALIFIG